MRLAVDREARGPAHASSCHGDFGSHWSGKYDPERAPEPRRLQRETRRALQLLGQLAADRVGDVDLAALQRGQPRRSSGITLKTSRFTLGVLRQYCRTPPAPARRRVERDELIWAGADRRLLEASSPTFSTYFFGTIQPAPVARRVEGQEIRPRLLELKADVVRIGVSTAATRAFSSRARRRDSARRRT